MNSILIFNYSIFDLELRRNKFKKIDELKQYYDDIDNIYIDLKYQTIFMESKNTIINLSIDDFVFKSCENSIETIKTFNEKVDFILDDDFIDFSNGEISSETDMEKISFEKLIQDLKSEQPPRIVKFDKVAYTTY
jgi:hypothetical protein